jgi:hypothetical protein
MKDEELVRRVLPSVIRASSFLRHLNFDIRHSSFVIPSILSTFPLFTTTIYW